MESPLCTAVAVWVLSSCLFMSERLSVRRDQEKKERERERERRGEKGRKRKREERRREGRKEREAARVCVCVCVEGEKNWEAVQGIQTGREVKKGKRGPEQSKREGESTHGGVSHSHILFISSWRQQHEASRT